ncbi:MAG: hypothetical protein GVY36_18250 [Verrucomicrobia bacterium]|jgi:hypothetical protein|nr:hypothetical protein [Verrucomicrobiota bacterium]
MNLDQKLLTTFDETSGVPGELRSCINAHGLYNTLQFVLRLSPRIHNILSNTPAGIHSSSNLNFEQVQAFSTFLHETIHWWQHIGSTSGLLLSLSHPVQSHANITHLRNFLKEVGPKKPIIGIARSKKQDSLYSEETLRETNVIVNNFKDISFYQIIATRPDLIRQNRIADDPFFENIGHSYYITYANTLRMLTGQFDPNFKFLSDPRKWEPEFRKLRENKQEGFYYGSPIAIPPVGLWEVFEGQARFVQLQYLHFGSGGRFGWEDARDMGMLGTMYSKAFETFLNLTDSEWPAEISSPLVGLFLAVCDMTINPGEGFPLPLTSPSTFITDNDPGMRFTFLFRMIALKAPHLKILVNEYSADEYLEVTEQLSKRLLTPSPMAIAHSVVKWSEEQDAMISLMKEEEAFQFSPMDMPARLLLSRYIVFNCDKVRRPEFMCWPGAWMAGERVEASGKEILDRNMALFVDKEDDDGIFPAIVPGKKADAIQNTFDQFYTWIVNYGLISQWISSDGPFRYNFEWLSTAHNPNEIEEWAKAGFERTFGISPDKFQS